MKQNKFFRITTPFLLFLFQLATVPEASAETKFFYTPEQLSVLKQVHELDFDPAADAEPEDESPANLSFLERFGIDLSPLDADVPFELDEPAFFPAAGPGTIDINLRTNRLTYGSLSSPISHGRKGKPTPTGNFRVGWKDADAYSATYSKYKMVGKKRVLVQKAKMPHSLFFIGGKYAIHGGNIGGQSRGCIRLPYGFAATLFNRVPVGTRVSIHY